jgi:hypothetical protein
MEMVISLMPSIQLMIDLMRTMIERLREIEPNNGRMKNGLLAQLVL